MKANITFSQCYYNTSLLNFFFRQQSIDTLESLIDCAKEDERTVMDLLNKYTEDSDLDDVEEDFYNESVKQLSYMYGIELDKDNENEDEDE